MSEYEDSDIDGSDIEDVKLKDEINTVLNKPEEIEFIETPDDVDDPREPGDSDQEEEDQLPDLEEVQDCDPGIGESTIEPVACVKSDHVQVRDLVAARESRMPDIPTTFELAGMSISRMCSIVAGSPALVPYAHFDPREIVHSEMVSNNVIRAVMRGDALWRWSDFNYFPRGFNSNETAESLHEIR